MEARNSWSPWRQSSQHIFFLHQTRRNSHWQNIYIKTSLCSAQLTATNMASVARRVLGSAALRASTRCAIQRSTTGPKAFSAQMQATRPLSTMDTMESGTKTYMSLYPEGSTDGGKRDVFLWKLESFIVQIHYSCNQRHRATVYPKGLLTNFFTLMPHILFNFNLRRAPRKYCTRLFYGDHAWEFWFISWMEKGQVGDSL